MRAALARALAAAVLMCGVTWAEGPNAIVALPTPTGTDACLSTVLPANDDGSTSIVPLPFTVNFFGATYGALYVNNNGNVTFDDPLATYTPFPLQTASRTIIAPFFADIDTRGIGSSPVTYSFGAGTFGARPAFCVNWVNVGYYSGHVDKTNSFQLLLVDRSDVQPGDFDIVMNYDKVQWESGDASGGAGGVGGVPGRMGYSNGVDQSFELPGSSVNGAFLDANPQTGLVWNSRNSVQLGRYVFPVRNGAPPAGATISGTVYAQSASPANVLGGAFVQVCATTGACSVTSTNVAGRYSVAGLVPGQYQVRALPPASSRVTPASIGSIVIVGNETFTDADLVLLGPAGMPTNVSITNRYVGQDGIPVVYWNEELTLTALGCDGGSASYDMTLGGMVTRSGPMNEGPAGTYTTAIAPLYPRTGMARVSIAIACPGGSTEHVAFDIYIDPSGTVRTVAGAPITGATVTLLRADSAAGPYAPVSDGSGIMAPTNRSNPDATDAGGHFGWDVIAGFYKVRAEHAGCVDPANRNRTFVDSAVLTVPPAVIDLDLRLDCAAALADHFKCYKTNALKTPSRPVVLADRFESTTATIMKPDSFCTAVDKNGEGISDPTAHLQCYKIKQAARSPKRAIIVQNQLGTEALVLSGARTLCVPSSTNTPSPSGLLEHFKCYQAKGTDFVQRTVTLADEFETKTTNIKKPATFCTAVDADGQIAHDPRANLECYKIADAPGQARFAPQTVNILNRLGDLMLTTKKADLFCVTSVIDAGSPR